MTNSRAVHIDYTGSKKLGKVGSRKLSVWVLSTFVFI